MSAELTCPNCEENLGKETENYNLAYCGNCGTGNISNPEGYERPVIKSRINVEDMDPEEGAWRRRKAKQLGMPS